ncbi:Copia protein [Senna tora]|uniref:Copia protein n=1 Tax=Senna tora TaxID=362788 RepID=A0A835CE25_9FABA|nr:Copia protein [Senna tora]
MYSCIPFFPSSVISSQSKAAYTLFSSSSQSTSVKLDRSNFLLWESVVLSFIEGNKLQSHISGLVSPSPRTVVASDGAEATPNPDFEECRLEKLSHFSSLIIQPSADVAIRDDGENRPSTVNNNAGRGGNRGGFRSGERVLDVNDKTEAEIPILVLDRGAGSKSGFEVEDKQRFSTDSISRVRINSTASSPSGEISPRASSSCHFSTSRDVSHAHAPVQHSSSESLLNSQASVPDVPSAHVEAFQSNEDCSGLQPTSSPLNEAQDNPRHPMMTRAKMGILKPKYPYVGLLSTETPISLDLASEPRIHRDDSGFYLSQSKYIMDLLKKFNMSDCAPVLTPMVTGRPFSKQVGNPMKDPSLFRQAVGSLQYLLTTRPDIAYSVNKLSQFMSDATDDHYQGVKRIFRTALHV